MTDPNSAPVTLAAGSYDYDTLHKGLNSAARGAASKYDGNVASTLASAVTAPFKDQDPRDIPGYKFVAVENDFGGTEHVQVYSEKLAEAQDADAGAIPEADALTHQAEARADASAKAPAPKE